MLVQAFEDDLEAVALLGQVLTELGEGDVALGLTPDVEDDQAGALVDGVDGGLDDGAGVDVEDGFVERALELLIVHRAKGFGDPRLELFGAEFELAESFGGECHEKGWWYGSLYGPDHVRRTRRA